VGCVSKRTEGGKGITSRPNCWELKKGQAPAAGKSYGDSCHAIEVTSRCRPGESVNIGTKKNGSKKETFGQPE